MKELLFSVTKKDLEITYFSGTGAGGQHRNRHKNCVRIKHEASGTMVTGQEERSKDRNLKKAFTRLTKHPKFLKWHRIHTAILLGDLATIENLVDNIPSTDLKIEKKVNGKWMEE